MVKIEELDQDFRNDIDLFFFSNRKDIDLNQHRKLILSSPLHYSYLRDCFFMSLDIFWKTGADLWDYRLHALYALNIKAINKLAHNHIKENMFSLMDSKKKLHSVYDSHYVQFIELCKILRERGENLSSIRAYFVGLCHSVSNKKLIEIVKNFIPSVFKDFQDFSSCIASKVVESDYYLRLLKDLEKEGITYDKESIVQLFNKLVTNPNKDYGTMIGVVSLINEDSIIESIKSNYTDQIKNGILETFAWMDRSDIDRNHFSLVTNLLKIDPTLIDEIMIHYNDKIDSWGHGLSGQWEGDKLINFLKKFPQANPKKLVVHLSSQSKTRVIRYLTKKMPSLEKLSMLV